MKKTKTARRGRIEPRHFAHSVCTCKGKDCRCHWIDRHRFFTTCPACKRIHFINRWERGRK